MKKNIFITAALILMASKATAEVDFFKLTTAVRNWDDSYQYLTVSATIDSITRDNTVTLYAEVVRSYRNGSSERAIGTFAFSKMDSGKWYLMNVNVPAQNSINYRNLLYQVDIE